MVPGYLWGKVMEGSGKSWVVLGRHEKRGEWCYRNGGKVGMNSVFLNVGEDREAGSVKASLIVFGSMMLTVNALMHMSPSVFN
nr:hypothetical protein [Tanacetum cinerariifolium]